MGDVRHILAGLGLTREAPAGRGSARDRWESLEALAQLAADYAAAHPGATLGEFAAELARRWRIEHAPALRGVTLTSLHAAKGLEWDTVFLPGLTEGNLPIVYAQTEEAVEEERRLLYVGVTRRPRAAVPVLAGGLVRRRAAGQETLPVPRRPPAAGRPAPGRPGARGE